MEVNYFTILYWFCHTSTWIHHRYTHVPHPKPPSLLHPPTIPLGHPSAPAPSKQYHASNLDWRFGNFKHYLNYNFTSICFLFIEKIRILNCIFYRTSLPQWFFIKKNCNKLIQTLHTGISDVQHLLSISDVLTLNSPIKKLANFFCKGWEYKTFWLWGTALVSAMVIMIGYVRTRHTGKSLSALPGSCIWFCLKYDQETLRLQNLNCDVVVRNISFGTRVSSFMSWFYLALCVCLLLLQSCLILCNPRASNLPGSSVHEILQARYWSGLSRSPPGESSRPWNQTCVSYFSCTGRKVLYH